MATADLGGYSLGCSAWVASCGGSGKPNVEFSGTFRIGSLGFERLTDDRIRILVPKCGRRFSTVGATNGVGLAWLAESASPIHTRELILGAAPAGMTEKLAFRPPSETTSITVALFDRAKGWLPEERSGPWR